MSDRAYVLSPQEAAQAVASGQARLVDLRAPEAFQAGHVPGAVSLDFAALVRTDKPVGGLLPDDATLSALFSGLGLVAGQPVIAYDDEGNGRASRLVWTLDAVGHGPAAILDGGFSAWEAVGFEVARGGASVPQRTEYVAHLARGGAVVAGRDWIRAHLESDDVVIVDTRSPAEYRGEDVRSARGGRIPGAVNFDWVKAMDPNRHRALRPHDDLMAELASLGITPEREVVTYCQTHHRSSHTYVVLRALGFERVRGYPGSWSDWGNRADTPIEA